MATRVSIDLAAWLGVALDVDDYLARTTYFPGPAQTRALAEIDLKRRILALHAADSHECVALHKCDDDPDCDGTKLGWTCTGRFGEYDPCPTVRLLASIYAERPGYRDQWRPQ